MDQQHFQGAVCLASFGQLWSGSPRQVTESSNIAVRLQAKVSSRKLLWCDFSLNQGCKSTDLWLLRPYGAHNLHSELRYSSNSLNDQVPGNQPIRRQHVMCNHVHSIVFACFFHTGKLCLGSMVHINFFLTTLCLVSSGFLANLFLISFCIQNRLRGNHSLRSPSFCTVCTVCPSRKWRRWYEEAKREKRLRNEQAPN